jgi:4-amino-4-deoxy-L-arabinose transferase-like glycosyltransferase
MNAKSQPPPLRTWLLLAVITAVTIAYLVAVAVDATPFLRGPAPMDVEWRWPRYAQPPYGRLWLPLAILLLYLGMIVWMERLDVDGFSRRRRSALLIALVVTALAIQGGVLYLARPDIVALLFERNASPLADGYYTAALTMDNLGETLRTYPTRMPTFPSDHPRTHPPGFALLHWALGRTLGRWPPLRTWVRWRACPTLRANGLTAGQMTSVLIVGLATPLIYALARRRGSVRAGLRAAALLALTPALMLFAPQIDQLFPLFTGLILWAFVRGWERRQVGWFAISGLFWSLATFLSLGLATLALWLALYALVRWLADRSGWSWLRLAIAAVAFGLGAASLWAGMWVTFGLDPWAVFRTGMAQHFEIVTGRRSYRLWVGYNLYDWAAFLGLPLAWLFVARAWTGVRAAVRRCWSQVDAVAIATAFTLLALDVSGTARGEVARLWLFLTPAVVLAVVSTRNAGILPAPLKGERRFMWLAVLQAIGLLVFATFLDVVPIVPLPTLQRTRTAGPDIQHEGSPEGPSRRVSTILGDQIELLGYDLDPTTVHPGQHLDLTLYWRSLTEPDEGYKVFVHVLDAESEVSAQVDGVPVRWTLPTTCWVRDEHIVDPYTVALPPDMPSGSYALSVGLYRETTGERLPVTGSHRDQVTLQPVKVTAP